MRLANKFPCHSGELYDSVKLFWPNAECLIMYEMKITKLYLTIT